MRRFVLRTEQTPLRALWHLGYAMLVRVVAGYLRAGNGDVAVYLRGTVARGEAVYGLSDIDLFVVHYGPEASASKDLRRLARRWRRLCRLWPLLADLVEVSAFREREFRKLASTPVLAESSAKDDGVRAPLAAAVEGDVLGPRTHLLAGARLYGPLGRWRAVAPRGDRRPRPRPNDEHRALWAWLDLQFYWKHAFWIAAHPNLPHAAYFCAKLIYEPAEVWLWLTDGERPRSRREVFAAARRRLPEEEEILDVGAHLLRALPRSPAAPLDRVLPWLVRIAGRIEAWIATEIGGSRTPVRLSGRTDELLADPTPLSSLTAPGSTPVPLPLTDWRARAVPDLLDEAFVVVPGDPGDPDVVATAARAAVPGLYPALETSALLFLPTILRGTKPLPGAALRAVQCQVSDPVSFAVARAEDTATFPETAGWSAHDSARRAVAEHAALLERLNRRLPGARLSLLLSAARAGLFLASVEAGEPELALTAAATAQALGDEAAEGFAAYRAWRIDGVMPPVGVERRLREQVRRVPAYAQPAMRPA